MRFNDFRGCLDAALDKMGNQESTFEKIADLLGSTRQDVIVTAIGKSGYIGQKFAASLRSVGIPSYFLHAAEAGHGDMGNVRQGQIVFAISKSGTTKEIEVLLPDLRARDCILVALTNRASSPLATAANEVLLTEVEDEGEPLNTIPLVSTQAALFACDYLVSLLTQKRQLTRENFLYNHPSGQIGSNLRYRLADFIDLNGRRAICVSPDDTAMEALLVTTKGRVGAVGVVDEEGVLVGYLTDGDFRRLIGREVDLKSIAVKVVMNKSPVTVQGEMLVGDVLSLFERSNPPIASAPIVSIGNVFLGLVSVHDLIKSAQ